MVEPTSSRPYMPGYGISGPSEGTGLLAWSWAEERLRGSHDYWLATVWPDARPHVMPVWGIWAEDSLWFSCSPGSRKTRNLAQNPSAVATTDDPLSPVVVEGTVERVHDPGVIEAFAVLYREFADALIDRQRNPASRLPPTLPGIRAAVRGMRFIERAIESDRQQSWVKF